MGSLEKVDKRLQGYVFASNDATLSQPLPALEKSRVEASKSCSLAEHAWTRVDSIPRAVSQHTTAKQRVAGHTGSAGREHNLDVTRRWIQLYHWPRAVVIAITELHASIPLVPQQQTWEESWQTLRREEELRYRLATMEYE